MLDRHTDKLDRPLLKLSESSDYIATVSDGIVVADEDGYIAWVNGWVQSETGLTLLELAGQHLEQLVPPGHCTECSLLLQDFFSGSQPSHARARTRLFRQNGTHFEAQVELSRLGVGEDETVLVVIRNVQERADAQARLSIAKKQQHLIGVLSAAINSGVDLKLVYEELAERLKELVPYDRFVVKRRISATQERTDFVSGVRIEGHDIGSIVEVPLTLHWPEMRDENGVLLADLTKPAPDDDPFWKILQDMGFKSSVGAPLGPPEHPIGYLSMRSKTPNVYDSDTTDFLMQIGRQLGPAIRNSELTASMMAMAGREAAVSQLGRLVSSTLDLDTVWDEFVAELRQVISADRVVITRYIPEEEAVADVHIWGVEVDNWQRNEMHLMSNATSGVIIQTREPVIEDLTVESTNGSIDHRKAGLKSALYVPLIYRGDVIGTLNVKSRDKNAYFEEDLHLLEMIANQIAGSVATSRIYAETVKSVELREIQTMLRANNERLAAESAFKSSLISTVSHEMRTPLTGMVAMAEVLYKNKPGNLTAQQLEQLQIIRKSGRMLFLLTDDLLTASSVEAGRLTIRPDQFKVADLLASIMRSLSPVFEERKQDLVISCDPEIEITADIMRLEQMVANLLSNASKYSPEKSTVSVTVRQEELSVVIAVSDQGPGISEEDQKHLFDTYFRASDTATRSAAGTGLGLFIVKTLAEAHNGAVWVESEPGRGSTFIIELPGDAAMVEDLDVA